VFLACVAGLSLATLLTAFVQGPEQFVLAQMLSRVFAMGALAVGMVIITEEFPAAHRGWGIGMVSALATAGSGLGAGLFAAIDFIPGGWRGLYAIGGVSLLLIPYWRRVVPETRRFRDRVGSSDGRHAPENMLTPLRRLALAIRRAWSSSSGCSPHGEACVSPVRRLHPQKAHGWAPVQYSLMVLVGGSESSEMSGSARGPGRRRGSACLSRAFRRVPVSTGPGSAGRLRADHHLRTAGGVILRALATELFPLPSEHRLGVPAHASDGLTAGSVAGIVGDAAEIARPPSLPGAVGG
jgi:MFS family permease